MTGGPGPVAARRIADGLTILRLALVPVYLLALARAVGAPWTVEGWGGAAVAVLVVATVSDALDGMVIRRYGRPSRRGALLDAGADRALQLGGLTFFTVASGPPLPVFPVWVLALFLVRDVALAARWGVLRLQGRSSNPEHRWHGRAATALGFALLVGGSVGLPWELLRPLAVAAAGTAVLSAGGYVVRHFASEG